MLRSGRRNARRFHGALLAAYVEQENLSPEDRRKLEANLELARELEAEVHCLKSGDLVDAILAFAREQHVTQVFLGYTQRDKPRWFSRSPIDRLIEEAADFDVGAACRVCARIWGKSRLLVRRTKACSRA